MGVDVKRLALQLINILPGTCLRNKMQRQAGAELCQAQEKLGLARNCGCFPLNITIDVVSICLEIEVAFCFP